MLPFRVQCETCHTRLKVSDAALVGQIHACPKCGGMVLLAPLAGYAVANLTPTPQAAPSIEVANFAAVEYLQLTPPPVEVAATPTPPLVVPTERRFTMFTTLAGGALGVAIGASALWLHSGPPPQPTPVKPPAPKVTAEDPVPATLTPPLAATRERSALPPADALAEETPPVAKVVQRAQPQPQAQDAPEVVEESQAAPLVVPPKIDPLEFDAANLDLVLVKGAKNTPNSTPIAAPAPAVAIEKNLDERLAMRAEERRAVVRRGESGPLPEVDVAAQLATPIAAVEMPKLPLWRAAEVMSDLAGAAITVDPAALRMAGRNANYPVLLSVSYESLAATLSGVITPMGLSYAERFGQLTLIKPGADKPREVRYQVEDLERDSSLDVAETVRDLLLKSGDDLQADSSELRLVAPLATHYEVLRFLEQWRKLRGLAPRSKYPAELLLTEPALTTLEPKLSKRTTFSFVAPTSLAEVFRYWARMAGVVVLVDWESLAQHELGPRSTIACSVADKPWGEALELVLAPLGLTWRAVDGETIQVTTTEADSATPMVEFYPAHAKLQAAEGATLLVDDRGKLVLVRAPANVQREVWVNSRER